MDAVRLITERRSIRRFKDQEVKRQTIEEIVELVKYAPSWKNKQIAGYIAVLDKEIKKKIAEEGVMGFEFNKKAIENAPCLIVVTTVNGRSGFEKDGSFSTSKGEHWQSFDAGIAAQTFCLAAYEKGLGTVIMGIYEEAKVIEILGIPEGRSVSALIPMGYPDEEPQAPKRRELEDLLIIR